MRIPDNATFIAVPSYGNDVDRMGLAIAVGASIVTQRRLPQLTLLFSAKANANGIFRTTFGNRATEQLLKTNNLIELNGTATRLHTLRTIEPHLEDGVVVGFWDEKHVLPKLDECRNASAVVYVSYTDKTDDPQWAVDRKAMILARTT